MRLDGKVAVITGGASGFGEGIVRRFAEEGARVVIADLNETAAQALARDVNGLAVRTDVSRGEDVKKLAQAATDKFGTIDILVNNAGIGHKPQPLDTLPESDFDRIIAVNAKSVFHTAHEIVPGMKAKKRGVILNIASTGGVSPRRERALRKLRPVRASSAIAPAMISGSATSASLRDSQCPLTPLRIPQGGCTTVTRVGATPAGLIGEDTGHRPRSSPVSRAFTTWR